MSDLVGNPGDRYSRDKANMVHGRKTRTLQNLGYHSLSFCGHFSFVFKLNLFALI